MNDPQPMTSVSLPGMDAPSTYWIDVTHLVESALEASRTGDSSFRASASGVEVQLISAAEPLPGDEADQLSKG
jgi:hypothetical protein